MVHDSTLARHRGIHPGFPIELHLASYLHFCGVEAVLGDFLKEPSQGSLNYFFLKQPLASSDSLAYGSLAFWRGLYYRLTNLVPIGRNLSLVCEPVAH